MSIAEPTIEMVMPEDLLAAALELDPAQGESLALDLIVSLEVHKEPEHGYEEAWAAEGERRMQSAKVGTARIVSWEEVKAQS